MTNSKMTYVSALEIAIASVESTEAAEKLTALKASLEKRATAERKPLANQTENVSIKAQILNAMSANTDYTISDMKKEFPFLADMSSQRVSALLRQLKDEGAVIRTEVKRKTYFPPCLIFLFKILFV